MEKIRFAQSYVKLWDKINLKLWTKIESNQIFLVTNNGLFSNFFYRYNRSANCTEKIAVVINAILNIKKYYFFVGDYGKETRKIFTLHLVCNNNIHNISMYPFFQISIHLLRISNSLLKIPVIAYNSAYFYETQLS